MRLMLRSRYLTRDANGRNVWQTSVERRTVPAAQTALLLCDVWDRHWSRGAQERLEAMIPRMSRVTSHLRERGVQIIHAPSDTMDFYRETAAFRRMAAVPVIEPPPPADHPDPPLPINDSDGGSDTGEPTWHLAWSRQHPGIEVDDRRDGVSDDGRTIYRFLRHRGLTQLLIMGVHTNMCVLHRSFGIKQMVRWGVQTALIRDLTDTMYNPAMPPYVAHEEGTRLVVEFIEKFWCPTILSSDLL